MTGFCRGRARSGRWRGLAARPMFWLGLAAGSLAGCEAQPRATPAQCREILGRIVALELREQGYRDPVLLQRRTRELERRFDSELERCVGRPMPRHALACVRRAPSAEAISHLCLGAD